MSNAIKQERLTAPTQLKASYSNDRMIFFSDGIFAITITLLVLEIKLPDLHTVPESQLSAQLWQALLQLIPSVLGCIISFVMLGLYWIAHHNMFIHIKHHNHGLLWLNLLFLMCIASVPFTTALLSHFPNQQLAVVVYATVLALTGAVLNLIWWYSTNNLLVGEETDAAFVASVYRYIRIAPTAYFLAIVFSFLNLTLAKFLFFAVAVFYILPKTYHRLHYRQLDHRFKHE